MEESGAKCKVHKIPVKPCCEIVQWGLEFRKKRKDWKERILECKLKNWTLD